MTHKPANRNLETASRIDSGPGVFGDLIQPFGLEESKGIWEQVDLTTAVRPWVKLEESTGSAGYEGPERLPFMEQKGK